jgi:hypothetical protein
MRVRLEVSIMREGRRALPVHMMKRTETREITRLIAGCIRMGRGKLAHRSSSVPC